jgi:hypothetical protein
MGRPWLSHCRLGLIFFSPSPLEVVVELTIAAAAVAQDPCMTIAGWELRQNPMG